MLERISTVWTVAGGEAHGRSDLPIHAASDPIAGVSLSSPCQPPTAMKGLGEGLRSLFGLSARSSSKMTLLAAI